MTHVIRRTAAQGRALPWAAALPLALGSCSHSPAQNIVGSFFPAWMLCAALGCLAAGVVRLALGAARLDRQVVAPPIAYAAVAVAVTLFVWLTQFGQ